MSSTTTEQATQAAETVLERADAQLDRLPSIDSTETTARYAAYLRNLKAVGLAGSRYLAYTSDVGEAFRPVVNPKVVSTAYAISWAYILGDVAYETHRAHNAGPSPREAGKLSEPTRLGLVATKRAVFQATASMLLPMFTIHSTVKYSALAMKKIKIRNPRVKAWTPTVAGLAVVPFLPYLFDHPVEKAVDTAFEWIEDRLIERAEQKRRWEAVGEKKEL